MALAALKTWVAEKLFAADLNAEFSHIRNNALSLISPLTGALDFDGKELILDGDADTSITADTDDQIDFRISGADDFQMTANTFTILSGSSLVSAGTIDMDGTELILDADADTSITADTDDQIDFRIAAADDFQMTANTFTALAGSSIVQTDGTMFIGDTVNGNMTIGGTWNQAGNDDEIGAWKSSDVAHLLTNVTEADNFGLIKKGAAATGGLSIEGFTDTGITSSALFLRASTTDAADNTHSTAGLGVIRLQASSNSSNSRGAVGTGRNLLSVDDNGTTELILDADGVLYLGTGGQNPTDIDEWHDVNLIRALTLQTNPGRKGIIDSQWDRFVTYNERDLIEIGVLTEYEKGVSKPMLSINQLGKLHNGAIWQLYTRHMELLERYDALEHKVFALEGHA